MKRIIVLSAIGLFSLAGCKQKIEYVDPTWARPIAPADGATLSLDFFKPDEIQVFTWEVRPNSTYRIHFDVDMYFENSATIDMGTTDSLKITNAEMTDMLRLVWPNFSSIKRFFWQVEQNTNGVIRTSWRYFNAIIAVENFIDSRDKQQYTARQFVLNNGRLMTIMGENLRAKIYADSTDFPVPVKWAPTADAVFNALAGGYYSWATATRMTWEEAKEADLNGEPVQGVCPDGWHLPSYAELYALRETVGSDVMGNLMKHPSYWKTTQDITNSTNMNIIASGYFWHEGVASLTNVFDSSTPSTSFWTSTPALTGVTFDWEGVLASDDTKRATCLSFYDDVTGGYFQGYGIIPMSENRCFPIRCVMDDMD